MKKHDDVKLISILIILVVCLFIMFISAATTRFIAKKVFHKNITWTEAILINGLLHR